ncbi:MAG: hypothetical protein KIPDCIKN_00888 [Haliscomenobacter sp.]|jgi:hypothetical protein|nr:hypothetical protein [Haliscomenobacter sp.]
MLYTCSLPKGIWEKGMIWLLFYAYFFINNLFKNINFGHYLCIFL